MLDFDTIHLVIALVGLLFGWNTILERRLNNMYKTLTEKMTDKQEVNTVVQKELKAQILRLESKIDRLIEMSLDRDFK